MRVERERGVERIGYYVASIIVFPVAIETEYAVNCTSYGQVSILSLGLIFSIIDIGFKVWVT